MVDHRLTDPDEGDPFEGALSEARQEADGGNRPSFRLGYWEPPEQYNQPHLEPDNDTRTVSHDVIGDASVVQNMGEKAESFTLRGDAFESDIETLRRFNGEKREIRHSVYSGLVLVESVSANSTSSWEKENGEVKWVYTYTLELTRIDDQEDDEFDDGMGGL